MREIRVIFGNKERGLIGTIYEENQLPAEMPLEYKIMSCIGDFMSRQKTYTKLVKVLVIEEDGTITEWERGGKGDDT